MPTIIEKLKSVDAKKFKYAKTKKAYRVLKMDSSNFAIEMLEDDGFVEDAKELFDVISQYEPQSVPNKYLTKSEKKTKKASTSKSSVKKDKSKKDSTDKLEQFREIIRNSKTLDEAYKESSGIKNVSAGVSNEFRERYGESGSLNQKQAFEKLYNEVKGIEKKTKAPSRSSSKKPSKKKVFWATEVKKIAKKKKISFAKAKDIYFEDREKYADWRKRVSETFSKKMDRLSKDPRYAGKLSTNSLPPNAKRSLQKDEQQKAIVPIKRKSPTFGKKNGAKQEYYYEYRDNRGDVDRKEGLKAGGKVATEDIYKKDYIVWGQEKNDDFDSALFTEAKTHKEAEAVCKTLESKHGVTNCRVQTVTPMIRAKGGEVINKKFYAKMLEEAKEDKKWAIEKEKEVGREWKEGSNMSREMLAERLDKSVEELAKSKYSYSKMRAFAQTEIGKPIDEAAKEKWEKITGEEITTYGRKWGSKKTKKKKPFADDLPFADGGKASVQDKRDELDRIDRELIYLGEEYMDKFDTPAEKKSKEAIALNKKIYKLESRRSNFSRSFKKGGKIGFDALEKEVSKDYEGEKVPKKYQKEYGKRYSKAEAKEVGAKVAGSVYQKQLKEKKAHGGELKSNWFEGDLSFLNW